MLFFKLTLPNAMDAFETTGHFRLTDNASFHVVDLSHDSVTTGLTATTAATNAIKDKTNARLVDISAAKAALPTTSNRCANPLRVGTTNRHASHLRITPTSTATIKC